MKFFTILVLCCLFAAAFAAMGKHSSDSSDSSSDSGKMGKDSDAGKGKGKGKSGKPGKSSSWGSFLPANAVIVIDEDGNIEPTSVTLNGAGQCIRFYNLDHIAYVIEGHSGPDLPWSVTIRPRSTAVQCFTASGNVVATIEPEDSSDVSSKSRKRVAYEDFQILITIKCDATTNDCCCGGSCSATTLTCSNTTSNYTGPISESDLAQVNQLQNVADVEIQWGDNIEYGTDNKQFKQFEATALKGKAYSNMVYGAVVFGVVVLAVLGAAALVAIRRRVPENQPLIKH